MYFFSSRQRPWRRRNFFIKKEFQARFIGRFLGILTVGCAISGYLMYILVNRDIEDAFYKTHLQLSSTGQLFLPSMIKANLGILALVVVAVAVVTLLISHKIAGPLLRLGRSTEKIAKRDFSGDFELRVSDELKSLAKSFEEMNEELKTRFNELRKQAEEIDQAAESLFYQQARESISRPGKDELTVREHIERLSENSYAFGRQISKFETSGKGGGKA